MAPTTAGLAIEWQINLAIFISCITLDSLSFNFIASHKFMHGSASIIIYGAKATPINCMFLVSYELTFDAGMRLLLLLQQHLVAQRCEKWCCTHRLAQRSSRFASQTPANGYDKTQQ